MFLLFFGRNTAKTIRPGHFTDQSDIAITLLINSFSVPGLLLFIGLTGHSYLSSVLVLGTVGKSGLNSDFY